MSEHIYRTQHHSRTLEVSIAYFATLDYFALLVTAPGRGDASVLYSSHDDRHVLTDCVSLDYFNAVLAALDLSVPSSMFDAVTRDRDAGGSSRLMLHSFERPPQPL